MSTSVGLQYYNNVLILTYKVPSLPEKAGEYLGIRGRMLASFPKIST